MLLKTKIHKIGGSHMLVIPGSMVEYFKIEPGKCQIKDLNKKEARVIFS